MDDRVLPMDGVHNFRDYGGYLCDGGRLKRRLLFRSAQHRDATKGDLSRIAALDLATVIDLRGGRERAANPCRRSDGFAAEIHFVDEDTTGIAPHMEAARKAAQGALSAAQVRQVMIDGYRAMPFRPHLLPILRRMFAVVADRPGASLIHCMAGKDRTGLAVALLHATMGVHRDDIVADYVLTNNAGRAEERLIDGARHMRAAFGEDLDDAALRVIMLVEPAYIDAAFAEIDRRQGSLDAFLRDRLGVTDTMRATLADRLVEPA